MPQKQIVRVPFPIGGRSDRFAYQGQPDKTTVAARNVWPDAQGRERGGSRPGFTRLFTTNVGGVIKGMGTINFIPNASSRITSRLCLIDDDGDLFVSDGMSGALSQITNTQPLKTGSTVELVQMTERNQKLYIACHSITQSESESTAILHQYDPIAGTVTPVIASDGTIPRGATCICTWRDRLVLAGGTTNPYGVFMSRQGDPEDWDYSETDVGAAVDLGLASAGQVGETVTSLTPHADNCLLIGCPSSLWILQGDPKQGGQLANLSRTHGVIDKHAWCTTPDGLFVFLSADGLYMVPAGCATDGNPVSLSRERLPVELLNINPSSATGGKYVSLSYDVRWRGIHIFVSPRSLSDSAEGTVHWFFDWETKSFWEVEFAEARFHPCVAHARPNYPSGESVVVMGCQDGYCRAYLSTADRDDDGLSTEKKIESYVTLGPFGDEPAMQCDIRLDEMDITMSADSDDVTWTAYKGNSAEEAVANMNDDQEAATGRATSGRNPRYFPRVKGATLFIRLYSKFAWALEAVNIVLAKLGRTRV